MRSPWGITKGLPEYGPTAGFIPNDYSSNSFSNLSDISRSLRSQKSAHCFDFDLLPAKKVGQRRRSTSEGDRASLQAGGTNSNVLPLSSVVVDPPSPHPSATAPSSPSHTGVGPFLGRAQYKCNKRTSPAFQSTSPDNGTSTLSPTSPAPHQFWFTTLIPSFTAGVPAFASPLTQIQSQAVKRAQWEVVVRASFAAAVIAGILTGIVVGVVP